MAISQPAVFVGALLLVACTEWRRAEADDKSIPYDSDEECKQIVGAEWFNNTCKCSEFFMAAPNRTLCLPRLANAAKACEVSEQCSDVMLFGECKSGACSCPDKFHYLKGRCWPSAGLGQTCSRSEECHVNYDPLAATCSEEHHICVCSDGYYKRGGIDCRREVTGPGGHCSLDNDCRFAGGLCDLDSKVCYSNVSGSTPVTTTTTQDPATSAGPSPVVNTSLAQEVEPAYVGMPCYNTSSCSALANSRCFGSPGRCECLPGSFGNNGTTACVKEIGESCSSARDCAGIDSSECRNDTCTCAVGNIATSNNRACMPPKKYANSCSPKFPEQCSDYGWWCECLDKPTGGGQQCLCAAGHHFVTEENLCWVSRGLNESCRDDLDCVVDVGSAVCSGNSTCQCASGLHLSYDGLNCVNVTALADKCSTSEDCSKLGSNIECSTNKCRCTTHYYEAVDSNGAQTCLPGLGAPCTTDTPTCSRENSVCEKNTCQCAEGHIASSNGEKCLEVAKRPGANCTEKQQCTKSLGELSLCKDGGCTCDVDDQYRDGMCREKKAPGDQCQTSDDCFVKNDLSYVECRNGLCQCKFGYFVLHNLECVPNDAASPMVTSKLLLVSFLIASLVAVVRSL